MGKPTFVGGRKINPLSTHSISVSGTCRCPPGCLWPCTLNNGLCWSHQCGNTHYSFVTKSESLNSNNIPAKDPRMIPQYPRKLIQYNRNTPVTFSSGRKFHQAKNLDRIK